MNWRTLQNTAGLLLDMPKELDILLRTALFRKSHEMKTLCEAGNKYSSNILHILGVCMSPTEMKPKLCVMNLDVVCLFNFIQYCLDLIDHKIFFDVQ